MTKDGRPSRLIDIRYFHPTADTYLEGNAEAVAFGRRLAWYLNGEGFSAGAYNSLYILFTEALPPGQVRVTDHGGDWWQRYTHVGVGSDFLQTSDARRIVEQGTVAALRAIRPDQASIIEEAADVSNRYGESLRFLLKTWSTKTYRIDVTCNISAWRANSYVTVSLTHLATQEYLEAEPLLFDAYPFASTILAAIKVHTSAARRAPRQSIESKETSFYQGGPLSFSLADFRPAQRPVTSKLVSRRG